MKTVIIGFAIIITTFAACNNNKESRENTATTDTSTANVVTPVIQTVSLNNVVTGYLGVKNALVNDNGKDAATAAKELTNALSQIDTVSLSAAQVKTYNEVKDDILEHAEHIHTNADKIAHQREHFDFLSKDVYDLVKVFPNDKTLYYDHCPMFNDRKGATWLSDVKEIKNPYYGKAMLTCGTVKEEIEQQK